MATSTDKQYLSQQLIDEIHRQAANIVWRMAIYAKFARNWYDIMTISPAGLIFFKGNSDTGFEHIMERHGYFSFSSYFGYGALGNPNKFSRNSTPMEDYRCVGDDVFLQQQKDTKPHADEDIFEKYRGTSTRFQGSDGTPREFHLVLYKGTKIVHSIYPSKNIDGKLPKRVLQTLVRDKANIKAFTKPCDDYYIFRIPYINEQGVTRYEIIFKIDIEKKMSKGYIQLNNFAGVPMQTTYPHCCHFPVNIEFPFSPFMDMPIEFQRFLNTLSLADLSKLEKQIANIEQGLQEYVSAKNFPENN